MINLIKNEFIKVLKQTGYRVLLIIFAVVLFFIPVFRLLINSSYSYNTTMAQEYNSCLDSADYFREQGWELDALEQDIRADAIGFFIDKGLEDWKCNYFLDGTYFFNLAFKKSEAFADFETISLYQCYMKEKGFSMLLDGSASANELYTSSFSYYMDEYFNSGEYYFDGVRSEMPTYKIQKMHDRAKDQRSRLEDFIISCQATDVLELYIQKTEYELDSATFFAEGYKNSSYVTVGDVVYRSTPQLLEEAERKVQYYEQLLDMFLFLYDELDTLDDWRFEFAHNILSSDFMLDKYSSPPVDEETFNKDNNRLYSLYYSSYDEYLKAMEKSRVEAERTLAVCSYAIENNIPPEGVSSSQKADLRSGVESASGYITIFLIVMAGMIVANEYTSGSVRLLLIRPKKRWKILLSKLLCVLGFDVILTAGSAVVLCLVGMLGGVGDTFTPDLVFIAGHVIPIPAFIETFGTVILLILQNLPIICFSFMLSGVMKRSTLAVTLSFVLYMLSSLISLIVLSVFGSSAPFVRYSILPYLSLVDFRHSATDYWISTLGEYVYDVFGTIYGSTALQYSLIYGIFIVLVHVAVILTITFASFNKQQIKN